MAGLPPFISFSTSYLELNSAVLRHTGNERFVGCGGGSGGARCLSLADYVMGPGTTRGATAAGGASVDHPPTATSMYREMDMRFWLDQAEAAMASLA